MKHNIKQRFDVFHRTWWVENPYWRSERGEKHYLARNVSLTVARAMRDDWNAQHDPGPLGDRAEFESC